MFKLRALSSSLGWSRTLHTPSAVLGGALPALKASPPPAFLGTPDPSLILRPSPPQVWHPPPVLHLSSPGLDRMSGSEPEPPSHSNPPPGGDSKDRSHELPSEDILNKMADFLSNDINNLLVKPMNYKMYRDDLVFENRVEGQVLRGLLDYHSFYRAFKVKLHLKYFFVTSRSQSIVIHTRTGRIAIKWRVLSLKMSTLFLEYFPKKLWVTRNRFDAMNVVQEGISTYYVDGNAKVYRVIYDNKDKDEPTSEKSQVDKIKEQLQKLKPQPQPSAPAM